ncbi:hypothetical protein [Luteolibacter sp. AS25]|uniref:hypothetical protein n=1 Tax=Luteolibacter sp. AS25 TaxID=3135776 RepID=UPI00398AB620
MTDVTGLRGYLYDLKTTAEFEFTDIAKNGKVNPDECYELIGDLARKGFRQKDLDEFRIGDTYCDLKNLSLKYSAAAVAPAAFGTPEIDPTGILIVYKGTIEEAPDKEIRFGGWFDDAMLVLVNGKVVFYTAWREGKTKYKSAEFGKFRANKVKETGGMTGSGDAYGDYLQLRKGDVVQIALAEIPGGKIGGVLKVQVKGQSYRNDKNDDPILHPFIAGKLSRDEEKALEKTGFEYNLRSIPEFKFAVAE